MRWPTPALPEQKPLVTAAVGRFDGSVTVLKPYEKRPDGRPYPSYRDLFPEPPPAGLVPSCAEAGMHRRADRRHRHAAGAGGDQADHRHRRAVARPPAALRCAGRPLRHDPLRGQGVTLVEADIAVDPIPAGVRPLGRDAGGHPRIVRLHGRRHRSALLGASADAGNACAQRRSPRSASWRWPATRSSAAPSSPRRPDHFYLGKLAVLPACQGRGVGRRLLEAAERHAVRAGKPVIELQTRVELTANHRAFRALGFVETGRTAHPGYDRPTSVTMRKRLA